MCTTEGVCGQVPTPNGPQSKASPKTFCHISARCPAPRDSISSQATMEGANATAFLAALAVARMIREEIPFEQTGVPMCMETTQARLDVAGT